MVIYMSLLSRDVKLRTITREYCREYYSNISGKWKLLKEFFWVPRVIKNRKPFLKTFRARHTFALKNVNGNITVILLLTLLWVILPIIFPVVILSLHLYLWVSRLLSVMSYVRSWATQLEQKLKLILVEPYGFNLNVISFIIIIHN